MNRQLMWDIAAEAHEALSTKPVAESVSSTQRSPVTATDVGVVDDLLLVSFTLTARADSFVYIQNIAELISDWDGDKESIVACVVTNFEETIAGGRWLVDAKLPYIAGHKLVIPSWQQGSRD